MIDIESMIFDSLRRLLTDKYPSCSVISEMTNIPSSFPCVMIVEADNYTLLQSRDSSNNENHAVLMYEVSVYANSVGKKTEAKTILEYIDKQLLSWGFVRIARIPMQLENTTIYRMMARYTVTVTSQKQLI